MNAEVAVIGGGLVGAALVGALGRDGWRCVLVDSSSLPPQTESWDTRIYALSPANQAFLEAIGVWGRLDPLRLAPVRTMRVFGDRGKRLEFSAYEAGVERLATIVEAGRVQRALWQGLQECSRVTLLCPDAPKSLRVREGEAELLLEDAGLVRARLLVGADGLHSWVRRAAGFPGSPRPLERTAVVANFACSVAHRDTAWQWFRGDGVLAWLPLPGERFSMVWSTSDSHAAELMSLAPRELCARVAEAGCRQLGELELITPPAAFPLFSLSVRSRVRERVTLVGDAAHVVHPLAGQGVNLGLGDAECLAQVLREGATRPRRDPGEGLLLRRFERARAEDILAMHLTTRGLQQLFESSLPGIAQMRNAGLKLTDRLPVVKNLLARRAMGLYR